MLESNEIGKTLIILEIKIYFWFEELAYIVLSTAFRGMKDCHMRSHSIL